jgi:gamma-glutamyltranspeptidase
VSDREPAIAPVSPVRGAHGAVASPHHLATQAGIDMLRRGGTAVDAAIATNAALSVVASYMCGLGGDAFWLIWDVDAGQALALNGSGRSGEGATIEAARSAGLSEMSVRGPWTVTVPGAIDSWREAHARFGKLAWADLLGPAIELADGFPASATWTDTVERAASVYGEASDWARTFRPNGRAWRVGELVALSGLAATLRILASEGAEAAYSGALAQRAAAYLGESGCPLLPADFAAHRSDWGAPIATTYRGVTSLSHPPNSCGPIALETLNILSCFEPPPSGAFDGRGVNDARWVHLGLEASRLALADRDALLTDPEHMPPGALETLLSGGHAAELAGRLDPDGVLQPEPSSLPRGGGTIALATADRWGGLVSLIESNYGGFGSGLVDPETGIAYQNRGSFFRLDPDHANALAPGKRTVHTLTPGMLLRDGLPWIAHASMGGEIQPQVFAQFVSAVVDGGVDVGTAVASPRWVTRIGRHLGPPALSVLESRYHLAVTQGLRDRGHEVEVVEPWSSEMGHEHAVEIVRDASGAGTSPTYAAAADPRSEGLPAAW